jgi:hypothetical protein
MENEFFTFFRFVAGGIFVATMLAGAYLLKNFERIFGATRDVPSENASARAYSATHVFILWIHAAVGSAAIALSLH